MMTKMQDSRHNGFGFRVSQRKSKIMHYHATLIDIAGYCKTLQDVANATAAKYPCNLAASGCPLSHLWLASAFEATNDKTWQDIDVILPFCIRAYL
jgi:hypothetical protein